MTDPTADLAKADALLRDIYEYVELGDGFAEKVRCAASATHI